ncbi:hypothetical protein MTR67_042886 [Solanum verrucosum]|uniref:Uncharacterized protein n=1 Tax=Solanum verrucosum TaxID=315347 RepID=A0AAF0ZS65_SOLVR|nr:hypothetical protein MTR67_042886 [Solanum verrucosum]
MPPMDATHGLYGDPRPVVHICNPSRTQPLNSSKGQPTVGPTDHRSNH